MNNTQALEMIDKVLPFVGKMPGYSDDDGNVLRYVRSQLQPERLKERAEQDVLGDDSSDLLREVTKQRCKPYLERLKREAAADAA